MKKHITSLMGNFSKLISIAGLLTLGVTGESTASPISVAHWINGSNQYAGTELNAGRTFVTDFKGSNDLTVTQLLGAVNGTFNETLNSSPGNNPAYLTSFVGNAVNGTGNGSAGTLTLLESGNSAGTLQFDFSRPLTVGDRIVLADIDWGEQIQIQAFSWNGSTYVSVSLTGWLEQDFTGMTGMLPNSTWANWNSSSGLFTAGTSNALNEPLNVLVPDQTINRLVFSKLSPVGASSTAIQFITNENAVPEPPTVLLGSIGGLLAWLFGQKGKRRGEKGPVRLGNVA